MARILAVVSDLMLASRVREGLGAAGHEVSFTSSLPQQLPEGLELLIADLDSARPETLTGLGVPVLGFYSHVDLVTRRAAQSAGLDLIVPRSRMARELPQLIAGLLQGDG